MECTLRKTWLMPAALLLCLQPRLAFQDRVERTKEAKLCQESAPKRSNATSISDTRVKDGLKDRVVSPEDVNERKREAYLAKEQKYMKALHKCFLDKNITTAAVSEPCLGRFVVFQLVECRAVAYSNSVQLGNSTFTQTKIKKFKECSREEFERKFAEIERLGTDLKIDTHLHSQ